MTIHHAKASSTARAEGILAVRQDMERWATHRLLSAIAQGMDQWTITHRAGMVSIAHTRTVEALGHLEACRWSERQYVW